jgi:hypothetical protein
MTSLHSISTLHIPPLDQHGSLRLADAQQKVGAERPDYSEFGILTTLVSRAMRLGRGKKIEPEAAHFTWAVEGEILK